MEGTITFEVEPLLNLEIDFDFIPGCPAKVDGPSDFWHPAEDPDYEIGEIRVCHKKQWHKVPDWLWEIMNSTYEEALIEAVNEWLDQT